MSHAPHAAVMKENILIQSMRLNIPKQNLAVKRLCPGKGLYTNTKSLEIVRKLRNKQGPTTTSTARYMPPKLLKKNA
jgi:hypothetical protein